jgi:hypothetical protein
MASAVGGSSPRVSVPFLTDTLRGQAWRLGEPAALPASVGVIRADQADAQREHGAEAGYGYPEAGETTVTVTDGKVIRMLVDDAPTIHDARRRDPRRARHTHARRRRVHGDRNR